MRRKNLEDRLQAVLSRYQLLVDSNPFHLRALIPPSEIWRLFVENDRQAENYDLDNYLQTDHLKDHNLAKTALTSTLNRISTLSSIVTPYWPILVKRLNLSVQAQESILLRDLIAYNKGWFLFELGEPGYIKGLYRAFQLIYEPQSSLQFNFILKIHRTATEGVANTNHRLFGVKHGGQLRICNKAWFFLYDGNANEEGIFERLEKKTSYASFEIDLFCITAKTPELLRSSTPVFGETVIKKKHPEFYAQLKSAQNNRELAKALYEFLESTPNKLRFVSEFEDNLVAEVSRLVHEAIDHYNSTPTQTAMEKIEAIVNVIQTLEGIHPMDDANCRTLCMITVNNLLFNSGLPLSFIRDPNRFDAKSHLDLVETIIEGMEDVFTLIETHSLHGVHTADLVALARKNNTVGATAEYFEEAIAIEQRARRRLQLTLPAGLKRPRSDDQDNRDDQDSPASKYARK